MAEWPNAVVLKTIEPKGSGGSNPSLSATGQSPTTYPVEPELRMRASPEDGFDKRSEMGHLQDDSEAMKHSFTNPSIRDLVTVIIRAFRQAKFRYYQIWSSLRL